MSYVILSLNIESQSKIPETFLVISILLEMLLFLKNKKNIKESRNELTVTLVFLVVQYFLRLHELTSRK